MRLSSAKLLIAALASVSTLAFAFCKPAAAVTLHGYCAGVGQCVDNSTNSPTTNNPPQDFGFTISSGPSTTDHLLMDILAPNNVTSGPTYGLTGTLSGTASLFSSTAWTSGFLDTYLGIAGSSANPIGAYLPSTQALDAGATGFDVYQVDLGSATLQSPSNPNVSPLETLSSSLPLGSYIVAFFDTDTTTCVKKERGTCIETAEFYDSTANSGAIFETGTPTATPLPAALPLFATGLGGLGLLGWRRKRKAQAVAA